MENFAKAPYEFIQSEESKLIIYNFASLCSLLHGKKLTMQAIFTLLLTDNLYREVLYDMLSTRNDLDIFNIFLSADPSVADSKNLFKAIKTYKSSQVENVK